MPYLTLRPPQLETLPGWLAPNGDFYACDYDQQIAHEALAISIVETLLQPEEQPDGDQQYLLNAGWVRVDIEACLGNKMLNPRITPAQYRSLVALANMDGDGMWEDYAKYSIQDFLETAIVR